MKRGAGADENSRGTGSAKKSGVKGSRAENEELGKENKSGGMRGVRVLYAA